MKVLIGLWTLVTISFSLSCDSGDVASRGSNASNPNVPQGVDPDSEEGTSDGADLNQFENDLKQAIGDQGSKSVFDEEESQKLPLEYDRNKPNLLRNGDFSSGNIEFWQIITPDNASINVSADTRKQLVGACAGVCNGAAVFQIVQFPSEPDSIILGLDHSGDGDQMQANIHVEFYDSTNQRLDSSENIFPVQVSTATGQFRKQVFAPSGATQSRLVIDFVTPQRVFYMDDIWIQAHTSP